jgi:phage tail-like protein
MSAQLPNQLINNLPSIYQTDPFLRQFLLAFEEVLLGNPASKLANATQVESKGLEEKIASIATYFDPQTTPEEFLSWLAGWVALSLRDDWGIDAQRRFISRVVSLYQKRGTKAGLIEMLKTYTGMGLGADKAVTVDVNELLFPLQIGNKNANQVGINTAIGGGPPYYFIVKMFVNAYDATTKQVKDRIARAIIEQEKPAHTNYKLITEIPTMQIGTHSTVGADTLLGNRNFKPES